VERCRVRPILIVLSLCAFLLVPFTAVGAEVAGWTGNVNLSLGLKFLDGDWVPVDIQAATAVQLDFRKTDWPVSVAIDYLHSEDDDNFFVHHKGSTWEFDLGARKVFEGLWVIRPFVGGGLAIINGALKDEGSHIDGSDTGVGVWVNGGFYFTLLQHFNIGAQVRYSTADVKIQGEKVDAGGTMAGLMLGYHW